MVITGSCLCLSVLLCFEHDSILDSILDTTLGPEGPG